MKKLLTVFFRRGLVAWGVGPVVLAVLYLVLHQHGAVELLTVEEVVTGIFSISALAFIVGGMNAVYQIERLPLMAAVLIHGLVLYISYLAVYLINGWLERGLFALGVFTVIFVVGYLVIWAVIYMVMKRKTARLNAMLKRKQGAQE